MVNKKERALITAAAFALSLAPCARQAGAGGCETLSPLSVNVQDYGVDHLPRLGFHPAGSDADACSWPLPPILPATVALPLHASNLHGELAEARLRLVSSGAIVGFTPGAGVGIIASEGPVVEGAFWVLDLVLQASLPCGPAVLGEVLVEVTTEREGIFVDVDGHLGVGAPSVVTASKGELPALTPRHGGYIGALDLYHCQPPLCPEPHAPVRDFAPLQSGGYVIELGFVAGGGDFTMIRYRTDGVAPGSVHDGQLLMVLPTVPGVSYALYHDNPQVSQYWYTAFSVDLVGEDVVRSSFLECDSSCSAMVDESVPSAPTSWGEVKSQYQ